MNNNNIEYELYLDESGNTGMNFLDKNQKIFFHGGWLIEKSKKEKIKESLSSLFQYVAGNEVKAAKALKDNENGKIIFTKMLLCMKENNSYPLITTVEKIYAISFNMVDTFFNVHYNHSLTDGFTTAGIKLSLSYYIYWEAIDSIEQDDNILNMYSKILANKVHNNKKEECIKSIRDKLACLFKDKFPIIHSNIMDITDGELSSISLNFNKNNYSTNIFSQSIYSILERLFSTIIKEEITIIHDELTNMKKILEPMMNLRLIRSNKPFSDLVKIELADSKKDVIIQAADLLCGYMNKYYDEINSIMKQENTNMSETDKILLTLFTQFNGQFYTADDIPKDKFSILDGEFSQYIKK